MGLKFYKDEEKIRRRSAIYLCGRRRRWFCVMILYGHEHPTEIVICHIERPLIIDYVNRFVPEVRSEVVTF
jgi:hypothetical protein